MEYRYTVNRVLRQTADELRSVAHEEAEIEARLLCIHWALKAARSLRQM